MVFLSAIVLALSSICRKCCELVYLNKRLSVNTYLHHLHPVPCKLYLCCILSINSSISEIIIFCYKCNDFFYHNLLFHAVFIIISLLRPRFSKSVLSNSVSSSAAARQVDTRLSYQKEMII